MFSKFHTFIFFYFSRRWKIETKGEFDILECVALKAKMYSLKLKYSPFQPNMDDNRRKKQFKEEKTLKVFSVKVNVLDFIFKL